MIPLYNTNISYHPFSHTYMCGEIIFWELSNTNKLTAIFWTVRQMKMRHRRVSLFELPLTMTKAIILLLRVTFNPENWWWRTDHLPKALARKVPRFVCNVPKMHQLIDALSEFECLHRVGIWYKRGSDFRLTDTIVRLIFCKTKIWIRLNFFWPDLISNPSLFRISCEKSFAWKCNAPFAPNQKCPSRKKYFTKIVLKVMAKLQ